MVGENQWHCQATSWKIALRTQGVTVKLKGKPSGSTALHWAEQLMQLTAVIA